MENPINIIEKANCYPAVYLPESAIMFIKNGFSFKEHAEYLGINEPQLDYKLYKLLSDNRKYYSKKYKLSEILLYTSEKIDKTLENERYYLGEYELPKKPIFHKEREIKKRFHNFKTYFEFLPSFIGGFIIYTIVLSIVLIIITFGDKEIYRKVLIISTLISLLAIFIILFIKEFKGETYIENEMLPLDIREKSLNNYKIELKKIMNLHKENYQKNYSKYYTKISFNKEKRTLEIFKNNNSKINKELKDVTPLKKGISELFFLKYLLSHFEREFVFVDKAPFNNGFSYQPDFIIFNKEIEMYFDIEIDEPYTLKDGLPIHNSRSMDQERNLFFNNLNWCVIRFTENQVLKQPDKCCNLIIDIMQSIRERKSIVNSLVTLENFWTHEEALVMYYEKTRDSLGRNDINS